MKRGRVNPETVALLAGLAGFSFPPERCSVLAPQLEWMLDEAARIEALDRAGVELANIFQPALWEPGDAWRERP